MPILINPDVNNPSVIVQNFETNSTVDLMEVLDVLKKSEQIYLLD